jgi:hypothetical protein
MSENTILEGAPVVSPAPVAPPAPKWTVVQVQGVLTQLVEQFRAANNSTMSVLLNNLKCDVDALPPSAFSDKENVSDRTREWIKADGRRDAFGNLSAAVQELVEKYGFRDVAEAAKEQREAYLELVEEAKEKVRAAQRAYEEAESAMSDANDALNELNIHATIELSAEGLDEAEGELEDISNDD